MRDKRRIAIWAGVAGLALLAGAGPAGASSDYSCDPVWALSDSGFSCGNRALLAPGNDTRVNLFLLRRTAPVGKTIAYAKPAWEERGFGHSFFGWGTLRDTYAGRSGTDEATFVDQPANSRCSSAASGQTAFEAALVAAKGIPEGERAALRGARATLAEKCSEINDHPDATLDTAWRAQVSSPSGREFAGYLDAATAFYIGQWDKARGGFATLAGARDPWIAEAAAYMALRVELNAAQAASFDEYGDFAGPDKVDKPAIQRARAAIATYLKRYPKGRYAVSARGLDRRALWLSGDLAGLGREYERLLQALPPDSPELATLIQEIDNKLILQKNAEAAVDSPMLLAVIDLMRMRQFDGEEQPPLSAATLAGQKGRFAARPDLYAYLQAAHAFYIAKDNARAASLLPDRVQQPASVPLAFSARMLRGMALAGGSGETGYWQGLIGAASDPYQRPLAELALALAWQKAGRFEAVFDAGSPVRDDRIRELLLMRLAGADLLRRFAADPASASHPRQIALFTLLHKDLTHGRYADFARDRALVPADAGTELSIWDFGTGDTVPIGVFTKGKWSGDLACPALDVTAGQLAQNPANVRARLCLGEFWRLNGFDRFTTLDPVQADGTLASGPGRFAGTVLTRGAIYAAVIADRQAAADERSYALYRAIRCYAPAGISDCGGEEVPIAQRKAWFDQLKREYPNSQWARSLRVYW
ncbi:MAG: hypothetical protein ABT11_20225 [Novosphingobium sp. SCN 66-18]|nr:MAG: hypothetical protein ABT11_20225 [Novosphingobium sp. SCN 66-18]